MSNSKGAAFYASGNIASEALRQYCADLWTEAYAAKAVRDDDVILLSWVSTLSTYCINNEVRTGTMSNAMPLMPAAACWGTDDAAVAAARPAGSRPGTAAGSVTRAHGPHEFTATSGWSAAGPHTVCDLGLTAGAATTSPQDRFQRHLPSPLPLPSRRSVRAGGGSGGHRSGYMYVREHVAGADIRGLTPSILPSILGRSPVAAQRVSARPGTP